MVPNPSLTLVIIVWSFLLLLDHYNIKISQIDVKSTLKSPKINPLTSMTSKKRSKSIQLLKSTLKERHFKEESEYVAYTEIEALEDELHTRLWSQHPKSQKNLVFFELLAQ